MVIKSYSFSNTEILQNINKLYLDNKGIELDPTYSKGNFYKDFPKPKFASDIMPRFDFVKKMNSTQLNFKSNSLNSICFDPPFLIGYGNAKANKNINALRFGIFKYYEDVLEYYKKSVKEFRRILKVNGILLFKSQDYSVSSNKSYFLHNDVYNICTEKNFEGIDLFILLAKNRIYNPNLKQRHSRKFHCYWYVFKKKGEKND
tara:strand:+ start:51 stop:659 length:609 start_codon:yes stop_codon:yes gene_type:complete